MYSCSKARSPKFLQNTSVERNRGIPSVNSIDLRREVDSTGSPIIYRRVYPTVPFSYRRVSSPIDCSIHSGIISSPVVSVAVH